MTVLRTPALASPRPDALHPSGIRVAGIRMLPVMGGKYRGGKIAPHRHQASAGQAARQEITQSGNFIFSCNAWKRGKPWRLRSSGSTLRATMLASCCLYARSSQVSAASVSFR